MRSSWTRAMNMTPARGGSRRSALLRTTLACCACGVLLAGQAGAATQLPFGFADSLVRGSLDFPVGMAFLPDGRLLFVEQKTARVRLLVHGALPAPDPVVTIPNVEASGNEQGLLGIAVDPGWPSRPY